MFLLHVIRLQKENRSIAIMLPGTTGQNRSILVPVLAGLLTFLLLFFYLKLGTGSSESGADSQGHKDKSLLPHFANPFHTDTWQFDVTRDGDDYGLSDSQCSAAFPKLYSDVDEMMSRRQTNHITREDFDSVEGDHGRFSIRAMIHDGDLYIISGDGLHGVQSRGFATMHAINRALLAYPSRVQLPNCEFRVYVGDKAGQGSDTLWVYTKPIESDTDSLWLMPDFGMYDWPEAMIGSYAKSRRDMMAVEEEVPWEEKVRKLVWRGFIYPDYQSRKDLVSVAQGKPWADVAAVSIGESDDDTIPIADFCRWMFVANVKGNSWSGGAKYRHNCNSVFVSNKIAWREIYTGAMVDSGPEQNWVSVREDWSDVEEKLQDLIADPNEAKRIADNSVRTLRDRYMTPAAEACYWRRLIQGYASVSFEPDFYEEDNKTLRGTPFSSVALMGVVKWEPGQDSLISGVD